MKRPPVIVAGPFGEFAVLHDQWKLIWNRQQISLFDVKEDPIEAHDVSVDHPLKVAELADALAPLMIPPSGSNRQGQ
jgi:hypothetical protein